MSARTPQSTRATDVLRGLMSLLGVLALVVGVPVALLAWVGSPLPAGMPSVSDITDALRDTYIPDEFLVKALALVCWIVWIELTASVLVEAVAYVRGRKAGSVPLAGGLQRGAARLVAGVALLGALTATKGLPTSGPTQPLAPPAQPVVAFVVDDGKAGGNSDAAAATPAVAPVALPVYEVQRRDTLWDIAETHLGDPFRWPEIFSLNEGCPQADGGCLADPDLIHPGWQLQLPADAVGVAPGAPAPAPVPAAPAPVPTPAAPHDSVAIEGGMVLIDEGGRPSGGDAVLASEAGATTTYDGMVLLPDDGASPAGRPGEAILAGPSGDDEIAGAEPAPGRGD